MGFRPISRIVKIWTQWTWASGLLDYCCFFFMGHNPFLCLFHLYISFPSALFVGIGLGWGWTRSRFGPLAHENAEKTSPIRLGCSMQRKEEGLVSIHIKKNWIDGWISLIKTYGQVFTREMVSYVFQTHYPNI